MTDRSKCEGEARHIAIDLLATCIHRNSAEPIEKYIKTLEEKLKTARKDAVRECIETVKKYQRWEKSRELTIRKMLEALSTLEDKEKV